MPAADPVLYQDKGVFQSNVYEVIRAHGSLANRFLAAEKQLAGLNPGDGSDFADLKTAVKDLTDSVKTISDDQRALKNKVDTLFPDEGTTPPTENTESQPAEPEPVPTAPDEPADVPTSDTPAP